MFEMKQKYEYPTDPEFPSGGGGGYTLHGKLRNSFSTAARGFFDGMSAVSVAATFLAMTQTPQNVVHLLEDVPFAVSLPLALVAELAVGFAGYKVTSCFNKLARNCNQSYGHFKSYALGIALPALVGMSGILAIAPTIIEHSLSNAQELTERHKEHHASHQEELQSLAKQSGFTLE